MHLLDGILLSKGDFFLRFLSRFGCSPLVQGLEELVMGFTFIILTSLERRLLVARGGGLLDLSRSAFSGLGHSHALVRP